MSFQREESIKKTRKEHKCDGCFVKMPIGSAAKRGAGTLDGDFYTYIICTECDEYLTDNREHFEDGWCEGDIGEARRESQGA